MLCLDISQTPKMGVGGRRWLAKLDMYKKVPIDLLEGSKEGSVISWVAILTILVLFYKETSEYFTSKLTPDLVLDRQSGKDFIRVQMNITMMDLKCDYVQIDVVSVLGNNQNVTKYLKKYPVDASGVMDAYAARNMRQKDIEPIALHDSAVTKSIEQLHESGEEAISLDETTLQFALNENDLVFVDFYASWCSHCRALAPTWEVLAKVMYDASDETVEDVGDEYAEEEYEEAGSLDLPVMIAKVDCATHHNLCLSQEIMAYPTMRLFVQGERYRLGDYRGQRTVMDFIQFLRHAEQELGREGKLKTENLNSAIEKHLNISAEEKHWMEALERTHHHHEIKWDPEKHPGCQIAGSILINRVPGNFHIEAFSPHHDLAPHMTNVSHEIHSLSFAPSGYNGKKSNTLPKDFEYKTKPMDGNVYVTENLHEAYHHYIKLITTNEFAYQVLQSTQLAVYRHDEVPEAKFIIDLSPIAVKYRKESRPLYDYITSLMAIIGGTFTVVGFFEAGVHRVSRRISRSRQRGRPAR